MTMTSGQDLMQDLQVLLRRLDAALTALPRLGKAFAEAERDYRVAMSQKILTLRDSGIPVTIIGDLTRGDRGVAELRFKRDVAEVTYNAAEETIRVWKLQCSLAESQIAREWSRKE
jgi:hypothetical protein